MSISKLSAVTCPCTLFHFVCCLFHSLVTEALKEVNPERKCYRLIGGVLVESTVKEVLPALESNKEMVSRVFEVGDDVATHCTCFRSRP